MGYRKFFDTLASTAIDATADALNAVGSLACVAGGAGFAASNALNEEITGSYYGMAAAHANVTIIMDAVQFNVGNNQTLPMSYSSDKDGAIHYHLQDYIPPATVKFISAICITSGTSLRLIGRGIQQWQQGRKDRAYFRETKGVDIQPPSWNEYKDQLLGSALSSFSYTLISSAAIGMVINYSGLPDSEQHITHPSEGEENARHSVYPGPVESKVYFFNREFTNNETVHFPFYPKPIKLLTTVIAQGTINITDGGGLFFKSHDKRSHLSPAIAAVGIASNRAGDFFTQKAHRQRELRIYESSDNGLMPDDMSHVINV